MPSNLPSTYGIADIAGSDSFVPLRYRAWEAATQAAAGGASPWSRFGAPNLRGAGVSGKGGRMGAHHAFLVTADFSTWR